MKWDICNNLKGYLGLHSFLNSVSRSKSIKIKFWPTKYNENFFPHFTFIYSIICLYQDELLVCLLESSI